MKNLAKMSFLPLLLFALLLISSCCVNGQTLTCSNGNRDLKIEDQFDPSRRANFRIETSECNILVRNALLKQVFLGATVKVLGVFQLHNSRLVIQNVIFTAHSTFDWAIKSDLKISNTTIEIDNVTWNVTESSNNNNNNNNNNKIFIPPSSNNRFTGSLFYTTTFMNFSSLAITNSKLVGLSYETQNAKEVKVSFCHLQAGVGKTQGYASGKLGRLLLVNNTMEVVEATSNSQKATTGGKSVDFLVHFFVVSGGNFEGRQLVIDHCHLLVRNMSQLERNYGTSFSSSVLGVRFFEISNGFLAGFGIGENQNREVAFLLPNNIDLVKELDDKNNQDLDDGGNKKNQTSFVISKSSCIIEKIHDLSTTTTSSSSSSSSSSSVSDKEGIEITFFRIVFHKVQLFKCALVLSRLNLIVKEVFIKEIISSSTSSSSSFSDPQPEASGVSIARFTCFVEENKLGGLVFEHIIVLVNMSQREIQTFNNNDGEIQQQKIVLGNVRGVMFDRFTVQFNDPLYFFSNISLLLLLPSSTTTTTTNNNNNVLTGNRFGLQAPISMCVACFFADWPYSDRKRNFGFFVKDTKILLLGGGGGGGGAAEGAEEDSSTMMISGVSPISNNNSYSVEIFHVLWRRAESGSSSIVPPSDLYVNRLLVTNCLTQLHSLQYRQQKQKSVVVVVDLSVFKLIEVNITRSTDDTLNGKQSVLLVANNTLNVSRVQIITNYSSSPSSSSFLNVSSSTSSLSLSVLSVCQNSKIEAWKQRSLLFHNNSILLKNSNNNNQDDNEKHLVNNFFPNQSIAIILLSESSKIQKAKRIELHDCLVSVSFFVSSEALMNSLGASIILGKASQFSTVSILRNSVEVSLLSSAGGGIFLVLSSLTVSIMKSSNFVSKEIDQFVIEENQVNVNRVPSSSFSSSSSSSCCYFSSSDYSSVTIFHLDGGASSFSRKNSLFAGWKSAGAASSSVFSVSQNKLLVNSLSSSSPSSPAGVLVAILLLENTYFSNWLNKASPATSSVGKNKMFIEANLLNATISFNQSSSSSPASLFLNSCLFCLAETTSSSSGSLSNFFFADNDLTSQNIVDTTRPPFSSSGPFLIQVKGNEMSLSLRESTSISISTSSKQKIFTSISLVKDSISSIDPNFTSILVDQNSVDVSTSSSLEFSTEANLVYLTSTSNNSISVNVSNTNVNIRNFNDDAEQDSSSIEFSLLKLNETSSFFKKTDKTNRQVLTEMFLQQEVEEEEESVSSSDDNSYPTILRRLENNKMSVSSRSEASSVCSLVSNEGRSLPYDGSKNFTLKMEFINNVVLSPEFNLTFFQFSKQAFLLLDSSRANNRKTRTRAQFFFLGNNNQASGNFLSDDNTLFPALESIASSSSSSKDYQFSLLQHSEWFFECTNRIPKFDSTISRMKSYLSSSSSSTQQQEILRKVRMLNCSKSVSASSIPTATPTTWSQTPQKTKSLASLSVSPSSNTTNSVSSSRILTKTKTPSESFSMEEERKKSPSRSSSLFSSSSSSFSPSYLLNSNNNSNSTTRSSSKLTRQQNEVTPTNNNSNLSRSQRSETKMTEGETNEDNNNNNTELDNNSNNTKKKKKKKKREGLFSPTSSLAIASSSSRAASAGFSLFGHSPSSTAPTISRIGVLRGSMARSKNCYGQGDDEESVNGNQTAAASEEDDGDDDEEEDERLDPLSSPLQLSIGRDNVRFFRGALVGNSIVCVGIAIALLLCSVVHVWKKGGKFMSSSSSSSSQKKDQQGETRTEKEEEKEEEEEEEKKEDDEELTFRKSLTIWSFPSRCVVPFLFLLPPSVALVPIMVSSSDSSGDIILVIFTGIIILLLSPLYLIKNALVGVLKYEKVKLCDRDPPSPAKNTPGWRLLFYEFIEGPQTWTDCDFKNDFLILIDPLRDVRFLLVDTTVSVLIGITSGISSVSSSEYCLPNAVITLVCLLTHFLFLLFYRPFFGVFDKYASLLLSFLSAVFGVCVLLVALSVASFVVMEIAEVVISSIGLLLAVMQGFGLIVEIYDNCFDHDNDDDDNNDGDDDDDNNDDDHGGEKKEEEVGKKKKKRKNKDYHDDEDDEQEELRTQHAFGGNYNNNKELSSSPSSSSSSSSSPSKMLFASSERRRVKEECAIDKLLQKLNPSLSSPSFATSSPEEEREGEEDEKEAEEPLLPGRGGEKKERRGRQQRQASTKKRLSQFAKHLEII